MLVGGCGPLKGAPLAMAGGGRENCCNPRDMTPEVVTEALGIVARS